VVNPNVVEEATEATEATVSATPVFRSGKTMVFTVHGKPKEVDISQSPLWDTAVEAVAHKVAKEKHISHEQARQKVALHHMKDVCSTMEVLLEKEENDKQTSAGVEAVSSPADYSRWTGPSVEKARDTVVKEFANDFAISEDEARELMRTEWKDAAEGRILEILEGR
jgi:hypothetical protein